MGKWEFLISIRVGWNQVDGDRFIREKKIS